jgi:hypothetical protein
MAQALSCRPLTAEARFSGSAHVGLVVGRVALGQVSHRVLRFSPVNIIPPWLSILICHLGICTLVAAVRRHSLTPSTCTNNATKLLVGLHSVFFFVNSCSLLIVRVECDYIVTGVVGCVMRVLVIPVRYDYVPDCFPPFSPPVAVARYLLPPAATADDHRKSMTACKVCTVRAACRLWERVNRVHFPGSSQWRQNILNLKGWA